MLMFFQNSEQAKTNDKPTTESETSKPLGSFDVYSDPEMERILQRVSEVGKVLLLSVMLKGIAILEKAVITCSTLMVILYTVLSDKIILL